MAHRDQCTADDRMGRRLEDRRQGLHDVIKALGTHLAHGDPAVSLPTVLAARIGELIQAHRVDVVPVGPTLSPRPGVAQGRRVRGLIPGPGDAPPLALEVELSNRSGDAWDRQVVDSAAHLLSLLLAVEGRGRLARRDPQAGASAVPLVGTSHAMCVLRERVERVAASDFTALIEGESGTGKELVARQIHDLSARRGGPFVAVNCAALVETLLEAELFGIEDRTATGVRGRRGKFENADGGTLFLDEVSDLSISGQAKLLRAIQDLAVERVGGHGVKHLNVRIVAATNTSLTAQVDRGLFRADLYYRLTGLEVQVPALRSRRDDILELARYFLASYGARSGLALSAAAADALTAYEWPGNVRELQRALEGAVALARGRVIDIGDLPRALRVPYAEIVERSLDASDSLRSWASRYARLVLERSGHNKRRACRVLGISYHTLQAHLRYGRPSTHRDDVA